MNIYKSSGLTRLPMRLWRGFHIWRAKRKYAQAYIHGLRAEILTDEADVLIARHVQQPQMPLPFEYGSDQDEQDHWMRGK